MANFQNSLYQLIKETSQKKGRPLKIIADWDECLFSFRPTVIYRIGSIKKSFPEFFKNFWENTYMKVSDNPSANKIFIYNPPQGEESVAYEKYQTLTEERKKDPDKRADKYNVFDVVHDQPCLSIGEDLLKCLKENLISKLAIISSSESSKKGRPSKAVMAKEKRFAKTFAKFPQCNLDVMRIKRINNKNKPHRWEWIRDNCPDFDIFIDDDKSWIKSVREHFGSEKIHIINDYKTNRELKGDNIYHVKTTVSDLKDSDFAIAALEKNLERLEKEIKEEAGIKNKNYFWLIPLLGIIFLVFSSILFSRVKNKKK